ncbi:hypothetical protein Peur_032288 [Populus x canadensis]
MKGAFTITFMFFRKYIELYLTSLIFKHITCLHAKQKQVNINMHMHSCIMCLAVLSSLLNLMREGTSTVGADKPSEEFSANVVKLFLRGGKFFAPFSAQSDKFNHSNSANPTQFHHILAATTN